MSPRPTAAQLVELRAALADALTFVADIGANAREKHSTLARMGIAATPFDATIARCDRLLFAGRAALDAAKGDGNA